MRSHRHSGRGDAFGAAALGLARVRVGCTLMGQAYQQSLAFACDRGAFRGGCEKDMVPPPQHSENEPSMKPARPTHHPLRRALRIVGIRPRLFISTAVGIAVALLLPASLRGAT